MTDAQQRILNILEGQADPLTSHELAELSGFTQTEVLKALNELQSTHEIYKGPLGYKLLRASAPSDDLLAVLKFLASDSRARLPKTIRDLMEWPEEQLKPVLRSGKANGLLFMSHQGYYYLTPKAAELIAAHCPGFVIKPHIMDKIKNPPQEFVINSVALAKTRERRDNQQQLPQIAEKSPAVEADTTTEHPALFEAKQIASLLAVKPVHPTLKQPELKLSILRELIKVFSPEAKAAASELKELVAFIEEYRKHECPA